MDLSGSRSRYALRALAVVSAATLSVSGCLTSSPDNKPTVAHITVDGTAPSPLQLVISTDFYETQDLDTGEISQIFNTADTLDITLPHDRTVDLADFGSIVVRLKNPVVATASVRMQISLDNGKGYDQSATLSDGAELVYVYVFNELVF
jgi:hypothetical protein